MSISVKKCRLPDRVAVIAILALLFAPFGISHAQEDPPSSVARLNYFDGPVSFLPAGSDNWSYATLNNPLTTGDQVWVDKGGRSELHLGSTALRLGSQTSMTISTLDDATVQLSLNQGTMNLHVRTVLPGQVMEVDTPNLAFTVQSPGDYRLTVDPNGQTTAVVVRSGNGFVQGDGGAGTAIGTQQRIVFSGTALQEVSADAAPPYDAFDNWLIQRDRREDQSVSARYVSRDMVGYEELDHYGTWNDDPNYGHVWIPTNPGIGWAPYHAGHWAWVAPWGWTWIDDQPWGFAPAHYGRWAYAQSRWCWVPGPVAARPVYAPALVAFIGGGNNHASWSISLSSGSAGVAWFPLGPGEAYRPAYNASPTYVNNLNRTVIVNKTVNITNVTNVNNTLYRTVYVNQGVQNAVTAVPATAFVKGQSTAAAAQKIDTRQFAHAQVVQISPAIAPVRESTRSAGKPAPSIVPPTAIANRQLVATRAPGQPAALHDALAARFNTPEGVVPGAGKPVVQPADTRTAASPARMKIVGQTPPNLARPNTPGNAPANGFGSAGKPVAPEAAPRNVVPRDIPHPPVVITPSPAQAEPLINRNREDRPATYPARTEVPRPMVEQPYRPQIQQPVPAPREESERIQKPQPRPEMREPVQQPQEQKVPVINPQVHRPEPKPKEEPRVKAEENKHEAEQKQ